MNIRIAGIVEESIVDGPGIRMAVFVQGCVRGCPGCQNPQTHALDGGTVCDTGDILRDFLEDPMLSGITFSGGEPFLQPEPLLALARQVHAAGKTVMSFSGYTCEELCRMGRNNPAAAGLLAELDILVDGPYLEEERDLGLDYRGSRNQRVLSREDIAAICAAENAAAAEEDGNG